MRMSEEEWDTVLNTNLKGASTYQGAHAAVHKTAQRRISTSLL
ncbi:MAG: hypothetical protein Ct9H300mP7_5240 [Verrucomicrobiota bacterium]|nr:MAG: hypothetical protein Ct9H300mP7_5240 [Verrucomicrobiota bacterium]